MKLVGSKQILVMWIRLRFVYTQRNRHGARQSHCQSLALCQWWWTLWDMKGFHTSSCLSKCPSEIWKVSFTKNGDVNVMFKRNLCISNVMGQSNCGLCRRENYWWLIWLILSTSSIVWTSCCLVLSSGVSEIRSIDILIGWTDKEKKLPCVLTGRFWLKNTKKN